MKLELELGFSHIRDSILAIGEKIETMEAHDAKCISLRHLRGALMEALPPEMRDMVRIAAGRKGKQS